jgi:hypothetical protein
VARIAVRRDAFKEGKFPAVCCKTGRPADVSRRWEFSNTPGWTWILLLFGIFPFLIATAFVTERFSGVLPLSTPAESRLVVAKRLVWLFGAAAVAFFALGLTSYDAVIPIALAFAGLCVITIAIRSFLSPNANLDGRDVVILSNVHRDFVAACHALPAANETPPAPTAPF